MPQDKGRNPEDRQGLSLNDDRRVKTLSPGALTAKRFFRNRLAVAGLVILTVMFLFSFVGGALIPYEQGQVFYREEVQMKEFAGISENTAFRFLAAPGMTFDAVLQAQFTLAQGKQQDRFSYRGIDYEITREGRDLYRLSAGDALVGIAYKDVVEPHGTEGPFSFELVYHALRAFAGGAAGFTADGTDYTLDDAGGIFAEGQEIGYISRFVVQSKVSGTVISRTLKEQLIQAVADGQQSVSFLWSMMQPIGCGLSGRGQLPAFGIPIPSPLQSIPWGQIKTAWTC